MCSTSTVDQRGGSTLPIWGNKETMNLNGLLLKNIHTSQYFKVNLFKLRQTRQVIDEIYFRVSHLEPWERGSDVRSKRTGLCSSIRGVGGEGIASTAFCILYKLFTMKPNRKTIRHIMDHPDSPYIRAIGFLYIRYTQPPTDLWAWFKPYFEDEQTLELKANGGRIVTIGELAQELLFKQQWFEIYLPRIPLPAVKELEKSYDEWKTSQRRDKNKRNSYGEKVH